MESTIGKVPMHGRHRNTCTVLVPTRAQNRGEYTIPKLSFGGIIYQMTIITLVTKSGLITTIIYHINHLSQSRVVVANDSG